MIPLITTKVQEFTQIGEHGVIETTYIEREFLGMPYEIRVKYIFHDGFKETKTDPAEDPSVEIISLTTTAFTPKFMANPSWQVLNASKDELWDISEDILDELS